MSAIDDLLKEKFGLTYEQLSEAERETLQSWQKVLNSNQLDIEDVRRFIKSMRVGIENELSVIKEVPVGWISIFALFVPFYGMIRKWYADQYRVGLEMRLRNVILIEAFLTGPATAKQALERQIASFASAKK